MGLTDTIPVKKVAKLPASSLFGSNPTIGNAAANNVDNQKKNLT